MGKENFPCEICELNFNDSSFLPKILRCGHTICIKCLENVIEVKPRCPKCRSEISGTVASHSTNFALLDLIEKKATRRPSTDCHVICRAAALENKLELKKKDIEEKKKQLYSYFESVQNNLDRVRKITKGQNDDIRLQSVGDILNSIEVEYKKSEVTEFDLFNKVKSKISVTIESEDFESNEEYLNKIYLHVVNDEAVFAMDNMEGRLRYGKVTSLDNLILMHALDLSTIPESAITIRFRDIKILSNKMKIHCFLEISTGAKGLRYPVRIELVNRFEALQFMKRCTGETGASFKGIEYGKGEDYDNASTGVLLFKNQPRDSERDTDGCLDYTFINPEGEKGKMNLMKNKLWVIGPYTQGFYIDYVYNDYALSEVIGMVVSPENLKDIVKFNEENCHNKIVDCGIYLEL